MPLFAVMCSLVVAVRHSSAVVMNGLQYRSVGSSGCDASQSQRAVRDGGAWRHLESWGDWNATM